MNKNLAHRLYCGVASQRGKPHTIRVDQRTGVPLEELGSVRLLETHAPLKTECTNNPAGTKLGQRQTERRVS